MSLKDLFGASSALGTGKKRIAAMISMAMIAGTFALVSAPAASAAAPPAAYTNGFENPSDVATPVSPSGDPMFNVTRVSSTTGGITSADGGWHAQTVPSTGSQFTRYGGYSSTFPTDGYTTSVDVYLDMDDSDVDDDIRFDWSSAVSTPAGAHRRDFVFSGGTDGLGDFVMSVSNTTPGWPANPDRDPFTIDATGWYTLQHTFSNVAGVLSVEMSVLDEGGAELKSWTVSDATDLIGVTVGGNRYGWLVTNQFSSLALDNITRSGVPTLGACLVAVTGPSPTTYTLLADCVTNQTIHVPNTDTDGTTFNGNGHSITAVDPSGGHFVGAVLQADAGVGAMTVKDLTVTVSGLTDVCDPSTPTDTRLRGILFDNVAGAITGNTVVGIKQGTNSGCQEGSGIDVRNAPFTKGGPDRLVTVMDNTVIDYQKTGIVASGHVAITIKNNVVTGAGPIDYIAQNGIQVGFGATAVVKSNTASGNNYTPADTLACGFLIYQADGVRASGNNFFANERNQCNFGKGGGSFEPSTP